MKKILIPIFGLVIILGAIYFTRINKTNANPSYFDYPRCATNTTSTSTPAFMTPGTATSTVACNTQGGTSQAWDSSTLLVNYIASSTGRLNINFEYAMPPVKDTTIDCSVTQGNCDWYPLLVTDIATSTLGAGNVFVGSNGALVWTFASSSQGGALLATTSNFITGAFPIKSPTRFIRAYFSVPIGTTNSAVWAAFVGKQEGR